MRIIASTKILPIEIDRAIRKGFTSFALYGETETLRIYNSVFSQEMKIGCLDSEKSKKIIANFNHLQWYKLSNFLRKLPEQPIVLEFDKIDDENVDIKLEQFIHKINFEHY